MHASKIAAAIALNIVLMTGVGAAADGPQDAIIRISATAMDGADAHHQALDFSCTVESQGAVIGTFNSMQGSLTVSHALPDLHMTCDKAGYETVRFVLNGLVTKDFAPKFTVERAS
jgi:hypothetical protein